MTALRVILLAGAAALVSLGGAAPTVAQEKPDHEVELTLTGCVIAGRGIDAFFVKDAVVTGHPDAPARAFYRFDEIDDLREHVGHRVAITGTADLADPDDATLRMSTSNDRVTTSVTAERERLTMDSPVWGGTIAGVALEADVVSYAFEIESVKRLAGPCGR